MDDQEYKAWWPLHLRVAKREVLSAEEQAVYVAGKKCLEEEEVLEGSLVRLRQTREEIRGLESEREHLLERRQQLRERVTVLESALSEKMKQLIGVGD